MHFRTLTEKDIRRDYIQVWDGKKGLKGYGETSITQHNWVEQVRGGLYLICESGVTLSTQDIRVYAPKNPEIINYQFIKGFKSSYGWWCQGYIGGHWRVLSPGQYNAHVEYYKCILVRERMAGIYEL